MRRPRIAPRLLFILYPLSFILSSPAQEKITYEDQVTPILRGHCFTCHNPDKSKGDLDLSTYGALLKGGGSGKAVQPGDAEGSKLYKSIVQTEEPYMPFNGPKIPDAEIEVLRKWIAGGLLEKASSRALAASKPKAELALKAGSAKRPDGPAVLPVDWLLAPVGHTERTTAVTALAAAPWAPLIAVGGQHQVLLYQSQTLALAGVLPFPDGDPECLRFSRDGRLLLVAGGHAAKSGFVDLYDVTTGRKVIRVGNEYDTVLAADLNSDQTEVALGGPARHVKVFSTRDGSLVHDLKKHTDWVTALEYSPDSVLLASGDRNGGLEVWEADTAQELYALAGHQAAITYLSWRDDSQVLLSASEDGTIRLWDMREGQEVAKWTAHRDGVLDARFAHDTKIVSCGRDHKVCVWDGGGKKQRSWDEGGDLPVRVALSDDSTRVVAASWSGKVGVWSAADGKPVGKVSPNPPTLAERLQAASQTLAAAEAAARKSDETLAAVEAEAAKKIAEAKAAAKKARGELAAAKAAVASIKAAETDAALRPAREALAARHLQQDQAASALAEAEAGNTKAAKELNEAQSGLATASEQLKTVKTEADQARQSEVASRKTLQETAQATATRPEDEAAIQSLVDQWSAFRAATNRVQTAGAAVTAAQARADGLAGQIKALTETAGAAASKLAAAKAALARASADLAAAKDRVANLTAEQARWQSAAN